MAFHLTSVKQGTIARALSFLADERSTGEASFSFGADLPTATVLFNDGRIIDASFGAIAGRAVLDLLLCQEYGVKEIQYRYQPWTDTKTVPESTNLLLEIDQIRNGVESCGASPLIYGHLKLVLIDTSETTRSSSVFELLQDEQPWEQDMQIPGSSRLNAPLLRCGLMAAALQQKTARYLTALVPVKVFTPLLELLEPMSLGERGNLLGYQKSLLPTPSAEYMPIERFYAFASAVENLGYKRSPEVGDATRKAIHKIIQQFGDPGGSGSAGAPVPMRPKPNGPSFSAEDKEP